jgi:solute:Na+ symporter, SSS family
VDIWTVIPIVIYFLVVAWASFLVYYRGEADTGRKFAIGVRTDYPKLTIFLTMTAALIGPTYSLGIVDRTFNQSGAFAVIYMALLVQIWFTGVYLSPTIRRTRLRDSATVGDITEVFYGKQSAALVGVITFLQYVAFTAVLSLGGSIILEQLFRIERYAGVVIVSGFVGLYTYFCGIAGVIKTDKAQFSVLVLFGIVAVLVGVLSLSAGTQAVSPSHVWVLPPEDITPVAFIGLLIGFLLGEAFQPFYLTRALIGKDENAVRWGFVATALFGVVWCVALGFVGVSLHALYSEAPQDQGILIRAANELLGSTILGQLAIGILAAGILGIVMSTLDAVLHAGAVAIARDTIGSWLGHDDRRQLAFSKMAVVIMVLAGATLASTDSDLLDLLFIAYSIWVPTMVGPIGYALIMRRTSGGWRSFVLSVTAGVVGYFASAAFAADYFPPILAGLILNLLTLIISERYMPPVAPVVLDFLPPERDPLLGSNPS